MYRTEGVLALLALYVGLAHSFSWEIVVAGSNQLEFYDNNGTRTHIENIPAKYISSLAYDPVHNRVLFAEYSSDYSSISSFDIATRKIILNLYRTKRYVTDVKWASYIQIAYDPATQLLFWTETGTDKNLILSKPGHTNTDKEKLLFNLDGDERISCITVDSCGGYIYWGTRRKIERARFDGSEREVVIDKNCFARSRIVVDQQAKKIYWLDNHLYGSWYQIYIESSDLNGENRRTVYYNDRDGKNAAYGLLVSKDFIYWRTQDTFSQLAKNPPHDKEVEAKQFSLEGWHPIGEGMASNYKIKNQMLGIQNCEPQKRPLPTYINERCGVTVCHNYCLQGDCSVSAEGQPKCRCNTGFSGERCEVSVCSTPTIVTDAASNSTVIESLIKDAMTKFTDDIKSTLRGWREEMEISIQSKLNDSIKNTLSDMKREMKRK